MKTRFCVVGDGAMGTACAILLASKPDHQTTIWCQFESNRASLIEKRENVKFLPGVPIPPIIAIESDFERVKDVDCFVVAVPTPYLSATLERLAPAWPPDPPIVSVVKGMEQKTFRAPTQIITAVLGERRLAVLTGPSHAEEIARGMPASVVAGSGDVRLAANVQQWFSTDRFRVYRTHDMRGAELAGAIKNVIAIAAGICEGLNFGDNARSALMTRGLVEMTRFGVAFGAEPATFYGLAGLGDLITTCISPHGRNHRVGLAIGQGKKLSEILASTEQIAEGVWSTRSVHQLAVKKGIDMPVTAELFQILFEDKDPRKAVDDLMRRPIGAE